MTRFEKYLVDREIDSIPISVGTAMAIQALAENKRYDSLWINVRTLVRNVLGAMPTEIRDEFTKSPAESAPAVAAVISQEVEVIRNYLNGRINSVKLYLLEYEDLAKKYPMAQLRVANTDKQKAMEKLMSTVLDKIMAADFDQVIEWDKGSELEGEYTNSLIITHYSVDLLSRTKFKQLRLLESHTGAIKSKSMWYTKLTDGRKLVNIPFNRFTIQIFGDGGILFDRMSTRFRNEIILLAREKKWTPVTTLDRIRFSLNSMKDKYSAEMLKKLI